jgi:vacuolar-type H+-ATPase subunit I/STV1
MADRRTARITLVMVREDKDAIMGELIALGCVEITEPDALLEDPALAALLTREAEDCDDLQPERETVLLGLNILEYYAPSTKAERARLSVTHGEFFDETTIAESLDLVKTLEMLDTKIQVLTDAEAVEESKERLLEVAEVKDMIAAQIANEAVRRPQLRIAYDHIGAKTALAAESGKLLGTEYTLVLTGWLPVKAEQKLVHILSKHACVWEFQTPPRGEPGVPFSPGGNVFHRLRVALYKLFKKSSYRRIAPLKLNAEYTDIIPEEPAHVKIRPEDIEIEEGYTISIDSSGAPDPAGGGDGEDYTGEIKLPGGDGAAGEAKKAKTTDDDWVQNNERY